MKFLWEELAIGTGENNLAALDPKLQSFVEPYDLFFIEDLTARLQQLAANSGIQNGQLVAQCLHTTTTLSINELDEPMLVADIYRTLNKLAPRVQDYLHNSPMRTKNLCADDKRCDRNADAHIKSFLIGNPSATCLIRQGQLVLGQWQRVSFIDFDGPRNRKIMVQISGV